MVAEVAQMARETALHTGHAAFSARVMHALGRVERHRLVPPEQAPLAYRNHPLPIGERQTISQPYIVALSTQLIDPQPHHVVLDVGTGSGYQAAVLAELVQQVYSVEIIESLGRSARERLGALGYRNIEVRIGDGSRGWEDKGPFDAIVVSAAAARIPPALVAQLKPGGKMVVPVGARLGAQELVLVEKQADGAIATRNVLPVRFVPLIEGAP
ncbi:MAG: protein-L-isoaspartate(D-aspartate) O-methyltransferase [Betaproteobacteria bacterium]|nr:protein-L-isoaspartate(D-aspartate) O-methyltransferase [Betaproteobacteria bacterium]